MGKKRIKIMVCDLATSADRKLYNKNSQEQPWNVGQSEVGL